MQSKKKNLRPLAGLSFLFGFRGRRPLGDKLGTQHSGGCHVLPVLIPKRWHFIIVPREKLSEVSSSIDRSHENGELSRELCTQKSLLPY